MSHPAIATARSGRESVLHRSRAYVGLMKLRLNSLVAGAALVGLAAAEPVALPLGAILGLALGVYLAACGTAALNMALESERDGRMHRTMLRSIPAGLLRSSEGLVFGWLLAVSGLLVLIATTNLLATALTGLTVLLYVFLYTPLKTRTPWNTVVGAVPGALPPLIGEAAAAGELTASGWSLFAIIFLWQFPHFLAIASIHADDYRRGGFRMLPVVDRSGNLTAWNAGLGALLLVPVSLAPAILGVCEVLPYVPVALALSLVFLAVTLRAGSLRTSRAWRIVLRASFIHLTGLLLMITLEQLLR